MIVDSAYDPSMLFGTGGDGAVTDSTKTGAMKPISNYIQNNAHGAIIYSTRDRVTALRLTGEGSIIKVGPPSTQKSEQILFERLSDESSPESERMDLLEQLEYLSLAIVQAANYIREVELCSLTQYIEIYKRSDIEK